MGTYVENTLHTAMFILCAAVFLLCQLILAFTVTLSILS